MGRHTAARWAHALATAAAVVASASPASPDRAASLQHDGGVPLRWHAAAAPPSLHSAPGGRPNADTFEYVDN